MSNQKIAIVTDSTSSLDFLKHHYDNIFMVRMPIFFGDKEYIDGETITVEEFYQRISTENTIPSTSQPSLGDTLNLYERIKAEGYTDIIHFPISKGLSGTYQSLFSIRELVDNVHVHIVDTKSTAVILGFIVLEAARLVSESKSVDEVLMYSNYLSNNFKPYFMVDDLKYLIKNGRLSNAAGFIGSILKIKPILTFNEEGQIVGIEKIRTTKKAMSHIIETVIEETKNLKRVQYFISYGGDQELVQSFKEIITEYNKFNMQEVLECILPSVIGAHVGCGIVALGYFILEK
ncbi:MAG: DegV family protein [Haloplasmataceae bacterium]|jgi:DegV family protein with EDD domain|nr:DegV family protein [Haloplasmataceae bacterium]